ncbi:MAG: hypothetical protein ACXAE3_07560 [Candidatus Kariarchaeaceae archaeon]
MENLSQDRQIEDFAPPFSGLFGLINLAWIVVSIFDNKLDPEKWIFLGLMSSGAVLTAYYLIIARKEKEPLRQTAAFFYLITWLGIGLFSNMNKPLFEFVFLSSTVTINLRQAMYTVLLPVLIVWIQPASSDYFFGLREASDEEKTKGLWKISVILIIILNIITVPPIAEFLIIIPLIYEHTSLYKMKKDTLPLLTLHIQRELFHKFAVPISMLKGVVIIMVAFLFEMITSRFWLLILLLYFVMSIVWFIDFLVPQEMRGRSESRIDEKDIEDKIEKRMEEFFNRDSKNRQSTKNKSSKSSDRSPPTQSDEIKVEVVNLKENHETNSDVVLHDNSAVLIPDREKAIGEKAHALGKRVRTELSKPQYNLNHIMSTLSKEDFSKAYRVDTAGYEFDSNEGPWSPPKDLILFPLELAEYDYRREDEILLLGFNRPIEEGSATITANFGGQNKTREFKVKGNQVQIGDTTFHMKTLVLTREQWDETRSQLEYIDDVKDISYTGFSTLHDLQEKLATMSQKWIEMRKQAEVAAVNFMAGLLGSNDPIFINRQEYIEGTYHALEPADEE